MYITVFVLALKKMQFICLKQLVASLVIAAAAGPALAVNLTVSAASSLTQSFKEIAKNYEVRFPGVKISLNFGASGALLQQLGKGAPVDVFASADQETMNLAEQQGLVAAGDRRDFVGNALVLIVPSDSKLGMANLQELAQPEVKRIAIGNPASVPAGRYARQALEGARLWPVLQPKIIITQNVRQSLDYVARGEVDAGFVYATDAALMKEKVRVAVQVPVKQAIRYSIAKIAGTPQGAEARRFIDYLASSAAQAVFARHGFSKP